ncbi:hypothetical protein [Lentibacter sp. XHP0401]|jgi:hypothetical protein|uniref:hypothetical protein n=1 Tax=Lentibacter sp. XHP0401 TaxID=2984334 RepID=UPI0021E73A1D|nr:hypothetical protein [Lentibacter sp. XHP0401]MCV2893566.1 hypothetical protein [Lentibacter sp. XHP0401]
MRAILPLVLIFTAVFAQAEEAVVGAHLDIELNAAAQTDAGCQLSFLIINGHEQDIAKAVFETVLFDSSGTVMQMTLFDMGELPAASPRVRQFVLPDLACEGLGQVLFNGTQVCHADGVEGNACIDGLTLHSRTSIKVQG